MSIIHASTRAAGIAWNVAQLINRSQPEGQLPIPVWSSTPLKKEKRERLFPPLGPRTTQSVCPKCLVEVRDGVLGGRMNATDLIRTILALLTRKFVEEAGTVFASKGL